MVTSDFRHKNVMIFYKLFLPVSCFDNCNVMQYTMSPYKHIDTWFSLFQIDKLPDEVRRELQSRQGTESFVLSYFLNFEYIHVEDNQN